jgi:[ribosomal protein S5]-alanine N-acetyltransferase
MSESSRKFALRTERLVLSPFREADIDELLQIFRDADVRRYLLDDGLVDREWVSAEVRASTSHFAAHGYGLWCMRTDHGGGIIGFVGFRFFHEPPELQLVCGLLPGSWHRGLATEACRRVIRYAFEELGFDRVVADADAANADSVRLMQRLGMTYERRVDRARLDTVCYELARPDPARGG